MFDIASALALIQEEELGNCRGKTFGKGLAKLASEKGKATEVEGFR